MDCNFHGGPASLGPDRASSLAARSCDSDSEALACDQEVGVDCLIIDLNVHDPPARDSAEESLLPTFSKKAPPSSPKLKSRKSS